MTFRGNPQVVRNWLVRALSFSAVAALTLNPVLTPVMAGDDGGGFTSQQSEQNWPGPV